MNSQPNQHEVYAISPIDGRYKSKTHTLSPYFSEFGLIKYRLRIEVAYLLALNKVDAIKLGLTPHQIDKIDQLVKNFSETDALRIKTIESTTNHDVKAVEYFMKEQLSTVLNANQIEYIHFGLTSQDINNSAVPLSVLEAMTEVMLPTLKAVVNSIKNHASNWADIPLLARTHGQPASPTKLGKEFMVFVERLEKQIKTLQSIEIEAKFGGATGNFNAHHVTYPQVDWVHFSNNLMASLGLKRQQLTTQIEHYDELGNLMDTLARIDNILIDFCRDVWTYISFDYFKQQLKDGEVGSSAMPHKVNPIDFENAEGNLGMATAILNHLTNKLPISRLQRDLTDSTVLRNIGVPLAHILIACNSILKGNGKLLINKEAIEKDLEKNWAVVAEAVQTILRSIGYEKPYEALKALTRTNDTITKQSMHEFINHLNCDQGIKDRMLQITPQNYTGIG
mgnify:CR=1 FL=1